MSAQGILNEKPELHSLCTLSPSIIRGESWLIIKNPLTAQFVRVHKRIWSVILQLDGSCTVQQWIERNSASFDNQQLLSVLLQLQSAGMVSGRIENAKGIYAAFGIFARKNPLMIRVPLFNPVRLLDAGCRLSALAPNVIWRSLCLFILVFAAYTLAISWVDMLQFWREFDVGKQLLWMIFLYPLTKCVHELAHGLVLRRFGGDVPEAGVSFLVLFPMPYVDATDAWTLPRKNRMWVTAAGMIADILLASLGVLLWYNLESGVLANMAFLLMLLSFSSVVLFNANPLLKFDGYFLLEDALDAPGLSRRSLAYYRYLLKRYVLAIRRVKPPVVAKGERYWLLSYGLSSTVYRFVIVAVISQYLILTLHEIGVVLSLFALIPLCALPIYRFFQYMLSSDELALQRKSAISKACILFLLSAVFVFAVPMPSSTRTEGVIWVEQQAEVYARQGGKIDAIYFENGTFVNKHQPILKLISPELIYELEKKKAAVRLARIEVNRHSHSDPSQARTATIYLNQVKSEVDDIKDKLDNLIVRAPVSGKLALNRNQSIVGSYVTQGELLAYVVGNDTRVVRTVVSQAAIGELEKGVSDAHVRLPQAMSQRVTATISKQVPSGNHQLPSVALANIGFGGVDIQLNKANNKVETREKVFHLELKLSSGMRELAAIPMGTRAYVTLEHVSEPLGFRWLRLSRQLLLNHLSV